MRRLTLSILIAALGLAPSAASAPSRALAPPEGRVAYAPRVFPKDQRIVDNWEIYTVSAEGGRSLNLTRSGDCHEGDPAWSHDGRWIAFACLSGRRTGVVVMSRDRRSIHTILELRRGMARDLAWSPDDRQLAFAGGGIKVINADGSGLRRLTRGPDASPSWSPDGRTIVFGRRGHVFRMRADGTALRRVGRGGNPALSPDGRTIAFLGDGGAVWLMDADGDRRRRLRGSGDGNFDLAWSPDGRHLAYQYQARELYVIRRDGTARRHLPTYSADFTGLDWGPDLPSSARG